MALLFLAATLSILDPASPANFKPLYKQHLARIAQQYGPASPQLAHAARDFGLFLISIGDTAAAAERLGQSLAIEESPDALEELAQLDASQTVKLLERALALRVKLNQPVGAAQVYAKLAEFYEARRAPAVAADYYRSALALFEKALPPGDIRLAGAIADLAFSLEHQEKFKEAEPLYRRALGIQERKLGPRHPEVAVTLNNLAGVLGASGRPGLAEPLLRRSISILETTLGPNHPRVAAALGNLGDLLTATGRETAAKPLYTRAIAIYEAAGDEESKAHLLNGMRASPAR